jgi:hypothetical protein
MSAGVSEDRRTHDSNKGGQVDDKVAALHAYRRARGLCQYCAKKYSRGHKCASMISLQVVQELWEMLQWDQGLDTASESSNTEHQLHLVLSQEALALGGSSKALKFLGSIQEHEVVILIDSGSSNSFINVKWSTQLSGFSELVHPVRVQVANGQVLQCSSVLQAAEWSVQGITFVSDLKVLPLPYYDMIIGMDWLECHSPMKVD